MRKALHGMALLLFVTFIECALAGSFDVSPRQFGSLANRILRQVGADLRLHLEKCVSGIGFECSFASASLTAQVQGVEEPPRTDKIVIEADLLREDPGAGPLATVADCVLALGATMVIFDPKLPAERRALLLSDLTTLALNSGRSGDDGADARYSLVFDEAASGRLSITVTPIERPPTL